MMEGRLTLPMAMRHPGMFLSHPGMAMLASYHCPPMTVSIESAITSRDCKENDIPVQAGNNESNGAITTRTPLFGLVVS